MWMDICLAAVLLLSAIDGFRKGILTTLAHFAGWLASIFIAVETYPLAARLISGNDKIYGFINEKISNKLMSDVGNSFTANNLPESFKFPEAIEKLISDSINSATGIIKETASGFIAKISINIISIIVIFIIIKIGLSIFIAAIEKLSDFFVLKQFNRIAGLLAGFIKGILLIFILLAILVPLINITENDFLAESLQTAYLTNYLYEHNLLFIIIKDFIRS